MTYTTCEAALLALVRAYNAGATFTEANCRISDMRVLDASGKDMAAVIRMVGDSQEGDELFQRKAHGKRQLLHEIGVTVFYKVKAGEGGPIVSYTGLTVLVDNLLEWLRKYEKLNAAANVRRAQPTRARRVTDLIPQQGAAPTHQFQEIVMQVWESITPTITEYS